MNPDRHNIFEVSVLDTCYLGQCPYSNMTCCFCPYNISFRSRWTDWNLKFARQHIIQFYSFIK